MSSVASRRIPLLDLRAQFEHIREEVMREVQRVIESQQFILGPDVSEFEQDIAAYCDVPYAIGCASGSDALTLAMMALGIGPGDEVLTVPYTFFATAGSIHEVGATPVFVDVERRTFNLNVDQLEDAVKNRPRLKAIVPVHLFGACADMDPIRDIAAKRGIPVIEDAAQSIGAEYKGARCGGLGAIGCFSFFPSKNLGGFGDGGMLTTRDPELNRILRSLRVHGSETKYVHDRVGINSRLDALQAAVLRVKLRRLDAWTARRQENAALYRSLLAEGRAPVAAPGLASYQTRHVYNQFVITCPNRDGLRKQLAEQGIGTEIYYPIPLHMQQCFAGLGYKAGDFPVSETLARESLALPIYAELSRDDISFIVSAIEEFYER